MRAGTQGPVGMIEGEARNREEQHDQQADHARVDVQDARPAQRPLLVAALASGRALGRATARAELDDDILEVTFGCRRGRHGLAGERKLLADDLVGPALPGRLDEENIGSGGNGRAGIVETIPRDADLAWHARGARDGADQIAATLAQPSLVGPIPALEIGDPAAALAGLDRQVNRAQRTSILVLDPYRHVRIEDAATAAGDIGVVDDQLLVARDGTSRRSSGRGGDGCRRRWGRGRRSFGDR